MALASTIKADGSSEDSGPDGSRRSRGRIWKYYTIISHLAQKVSDKTTQVEANSC